MNDRERIQELEAQVTRLNAALQRSVSIIQYQHEMEQAYRRGFDAAAATAKDATKTLLSRHYETQVYYLELVGGLGDLRGLVFDSRANMPKAHYHKRLRDLATKIAGASVNLKNLFAEHAQLASIETGYEITVNPSDHPLLQYASDIQDGITKAITGDDSDLLKHLSNHAWAKDLAKLISQLEQGGHPSGEYPYTTYLRREAKLLQEDHQDWSYKQIATRIRGRLKEERNELEKRHLSLSSDKAEALRKLEGKRPDKVISRVLA